MNLFYVDLETTGLYFFKHGVHQISIIIEIDGEVKESRTFNVKPHRAAVIEPEALAIAGKTVEDLEDYPAQMDVYDEIKTMIRRYHKRAKDYKTKFTLAGYNIAAFDNAFFRAFFKQCGDEWYNSNFWIAPIDVMILAAEAIGDRRPELPNFKLPTLCEYFGITVEKSRLHDAEYDIFLTRELHKKIQQCKKSDSFPVSVKQNT